MPGSMQVILKYQLTNLKPNLLGTKCECLLWVEVHIHLRDKYSPKKCMILILFEKVHNFDTLCWLIIKCHPQRFILCASTVLDVSDVNIWALLQEYVPQIERLPIFHC